MIGRLRDIGRKLTDLLGRSRGRPSKSGNASVSCTPGACGLIKSERRSRQPREVLRTLNSTSPTTEPTAARTAERTSVNDEKPEDVNEAIVRPWYEAVAQKNVEKRCLP